MRTVLIVFCSFLSTGIFAQLEVGSTWYVRQYIENPIWPGKSYDTTRVITALKDTAINLVTYQKISGYCYCTKTGTAPEIRVLRQVGEKVFFRYDDKDHLLYDYALQKGDTLKIWMPWQQYFQDSVYAIIDSVVQREINGNMLPVQYFHHPQGSNFRADFGKFIIKGIGSNYCLFPQWGACEGGTWPLLCYESPSIGLLKFAPGNCILSATNDLESFASIQLTYDRNQQQLAVSMDRSFDTPQLLVTALSGRVMLQQPIAAQNQSFSVEALPSGVYFATILVDNRAVKTMKFVRMGD